MEEQHVEVDDDVVKERDFVLVDFHERVERLALADALRLLQQEER